MFMPVMGVRQVFVCVRELFVRVQMAVLPAETIRVSMVVVPIRMGVAVIVS